MSSIRIYHPDLIQSLINSKGSEGCGKLNRLCTKEWIALVDFEYCCSEK